MEIIKGYTKLNYSNFQRFLHRAFVDSEKREIQIAAEINLNSPNTVRNAFHINQQVVSDKVLTNIMTSLGLDGFIVWDKGERQYFVANKKIQKQKVNGSV